MQNPRNSLFSPPTPRRANVVSAAEIQVVTDFDDQSYETFNGDVEVHSMDADGCFLPYFGHCSLYKTMAEHNEALVEQLICKHSIPESKPGKTVFMVGSARQSIFRDLLGIYQHGGNYVTESIFFAFAEFVNDFKKQLKKKPENCDLNLDTIILEPFLLHDILFNRNSGDCFAEALQTYGEEWSAELKKAFHLLNKYANPDYLQQDLFLKIREIAARTADTFLSMQASPTQIHFSEGPGKFTLLYAQIHHVAKKYHPKKCIHFHFYDDNHEILQNLIAVFSHDKDLIPKNMTLHFHHYMRGSHAVDTSRTPIIHHIQGTGIIDDHYRETVKDITKTIPIYDRGNIAFTEKTTPMHIGDPLDTFFDIQIGQRTRVVPKPAYSEFLAGRYARLCPTVEPVSPVIMPKSAQPTPPLVSLSFTKSTVLSTVGSLFGRFFAWSNASQAENTTRNVAEAAQHQ